MLILTSHILAQRVSDSERLYQTALDTQRRGDLTAASIKFKAIVDSATAERAVKAKALVRQAEVAEQLGQPSPQIYRAILKDFADQPAAAIAKRKLAEAQQRADAQQRAAGQQRATSRLSTDAGSMVQRRIDFGPGIARALATDGEQVVYWADADDTQLAIGDVAGLERRLIHRFDKSPARVVVSRDLRMVLFSTLGDGRYFVSATDGTDTHELALTQNGARAITYGTPSCASWSWDNRSILLCVLHPDGSDRLIKVSPTDGRFEDVLPFGVGAKAAKFSPDGRFIAYAVALNGPVYVVPAAGGESALISREGRLAEWTHDGEYLLIGREATSDIETIAYRVREGVATGERHSLGDVSWGVPTVLPSGALVATKGVAERPTARVAPLDPRNNLRWAPIDLGLGEALSSRVRPSWAPDGRQIAYVDESRTLRLRDVVTGAGVPVFRDKDLYQCIWAKQRPQLFCSRLLIGQDRVTEISMVGLDGHADRVGVLSGLLSFVRVSSDDRTLTLRRNGPDQYQEIDWDIVSGEQVSRPPLITRSDDGRWIASVDVTDDRRIAIAVRSASGSNGEGFVVRSKLVADPLRLAVSQPFPVAVFTPDSTGVLFRDLDEQGTPGLYRVAVAGGRPQRLGDFPFNSILNHLSISPDGSRVLTIGDVRESLSWWIVERFIPNPRAAREKPSTAPSATQARAPSSK